MVKSMTGFGRGQALDESYKITIELKTVNNRYLEVLTRLPRAIASLEEPIKKRINSFIARGRVEIFLTLEDCRKEEKQLRVDKSLAMAYYNAGLELADLCGIEPKLSLDTLISLPEIWSLEKADEDLEAISALVFQALDEAMTALVEMRQLEGDKLAKDLLFRKNLIEGWVKQISERAPVVVTEYQEKLAVKINELLGDKYMLDEARFANEVAYYADKISLTEELIRLDSHLQQLEALLHTNDVVGRKLDFLLQELNREINTIGSKSNDLAINNLVIDTKSELEKIREQVQNIE